MYTYLTPEIAAGVRLPEPEYASVLDHKMGLLGLGYIGIHDVDLTMTVNGFPDKEDLTSFGVVSPFYDAVDRKVDSALWGIFEPLQRSGELNLAQAELWWQTSLKLLTKDRTPPADLTPAEFAADPQRYTPITRDMVREAGEKMRPRPGVREYTDALRQSDAPNAWITAGLADVCEAFAVKQDIEPDLLLGTRFVYTGDVLTGWREDTLIHPLNKDEQSQGRIRSLRKPDEFDGRFIYPGTLLLGDSIRDTNMVRGDKALRGSVANPHGPNDEQYLRSRFEAGYDFVIDDEGLYVATAIVHRINEIRNDPPRSLPIITKF